MGFAVLLHLIAHAALVIFLTIIFYPLFLQFSVLVEPLYGAERVPLANPPLIPLCQRSPSETTSIPFFFKEHEEEGFTKDEIEERTGVSISDVIPHRFPRFEKIATTRHQGEIFSHYEFDWSGALFFIGIAVAVIGFFLAAFH